LRKLIAISIVGSLIAGLLAVGCGGGGGSADAEQIDKATFVKQANKICEQASGRLAADIISISKRESTGPNAGSTKAQRALVEDGLIPRLEEELQGVQALGIPEEGSSEIERFLEAYQQGIDKTKAKSKAVAVSEDVAPYEVIAVAGTPLGITECPISPVNAPN
jgi:membrane protein involved in colicin uptake